MYASSTEGERVVPEGLVLDNRVVDVRPFGSNDGHFVGAFSNSRLVMNCISDGLQQ